MAQIIESIHKVELLAMDNEEVQKVTEIGNSLEVIPGRNEMNSGLSMHSIQVLPKLKSLEMELKK